MTDKPGDHGRILEHDHKTHMWAGPGAIVRGEIEEVKNTTVSRRKCGCIRTSAKLKNILATFPAPPPPTPVSGCMFEKTSGYGYGHTGHKQAMNDCCGDKKRMSRSWQVIAELVALVQLSVTATALALYYLIYCYMQLVYYTLRSVLYFHNADGPMKITIGVVTLTTLIVGFNLLLRMEKVLGTMF